MANSLLLMLGKGWVLLKNRRKPMNILKGLPYKVITNTLDAIFFFCVTMGLLMKFIDGCAVADAGLCSSRLDTLGYQEDAQVG